ncbi:RING-H2 finger protein ATL73-like [Ipomoea triloba]|uniref:RING-H2 finger protein ATL73-like n=1 Tax=Ipomoea triloba TaxID=35885 RepID=UPI00125CD5E8|nr:RING-H2 finger protein ATL73-like [Ipomoea triloba]
MRVTPLPTTNMTALNYTDDPKLDRAMVVVLASLLGALLLVVAVNAIVRCILRRIRRLSPPVPEPGAAALPPSTAAGLKEDVLEQIPVVVYKSEVDIFGTECPICLTEFNEGQNLRLLPRCSHGFHLKCIDLWLLSHSSCPTCRRPLLDDDDTP